MPGRRIVETLAAEFAQALAGAFEKAQEAALGFQRGVVVAIHLGVDAARFVEFAEDCQGTVAQAFLDEIMRRDAPSDAGFHQTQHVVEVFHEEHLVADRPQQVRMLPGAAAEADLPVIGQARDAVQGGIAQRVLRMGDDERLGVAEHALVEAGDLQFLVDGDGDIDFRVVLLDRRQAIGGRGAYQADHVEIVEQYAAHRIAERRRDGGVQQHPEIARTLVEIEGDVADQLLVVQQAAHVRDQAKRLLGGFDLVAVPTDQLHAQVDFQVADRRADRGVRLAQDPRSGGNRTGGDDLEEHVHVIQVMNRHPLFLLLGGACRFP